MIRSILPKAKEISQEILFKLYVSEKKSVAQIADMFSCSENKINYWLSKYEIPKRSISDAIYQLKNPHGDPFSVRYPETTEEGILFGLGLALYWGEGEKKGKGGLRITNSDAKLL